ncbi:hypothetical protein A6456_21845 [Paraburkholderia tropica]|nr:hypothetical protein A6456_21845 [Paraburkholderia tropica]
MDIGARAADLVASTGALVEELKREANALRASGAGENDPQIIKLAQDCAYIEAVVTATCKAMTKTWECILARTLLPVASSSIRSW